MAENINQVFTANPASSMDSTDLLYLGRSPYGTTDDFAITFNNLQLSIDSVGVITTGTWNADTLAIAYGGTGVTTVTSSPSSSSWAGWDANANLASNNLLNGFSSVVSSAGTTTLDVASEYYQELTGSTTQTYQLPVVSGLTLGQSWLIMNNSSGDLTINSSGGNEIAVIIGDSSALVTVVSLTGTGAASWNVAYVLNGGGVLSIAGTANQVIASASTGDVVLSLPQSLAITSSPTFDALTATGALSIGSGSNLFTLNSSTAIDGFIDDDSMATATATNVSTAESIKAYVDGLIGGGVPGPGSAGVVLRSDGAAWQNSGFTLASSYALNDLIYCSSTNNLTALTAVNNASFSTNASGLPVWLALTDGEIVIGSSAGAPIAATLTAGSNITITNAGNSITIADSGAGGSVDSGTINDMAYYAATGNAVSGYTLGTDVLTALADNANGSGAISLTTSPIFITPTLGVASATSLLASSTITGSKLIPTGSSTTGNGMYLGAANELRFSNNGSRTMSINATGQVVAGNQNPPDSLANLVTYVSGQGLVASYTSSDVNLSGAMSSIISMRSGNENYAISNVGSNAYSADAFGTAVTRPNSSYSAWTWQATCTKVALATSSAMALITQDTAGASITPISISNTGAATFLNTVAATSINFGGSSLGDYIAVTSWTPVVTFATAGDLSVSYSVQVAAYSRVGDVVDIIFNIGFIPTYTTASGAFRITGLPFASNATASRVSYGICNNGSTLTYPAGATTLNAYIATNNTYIQVIPIGSATSLAALSTSNFASGTAFSLSGTIRYFI